MSGLALNPNTVEPDKTCVERLWGFITRRLTGEDFETFVYDNLDALKTVLSDDSVQYLLEFPYKQGNFGALRLDLRQVIEPVPRDCECLRIPDEIEIDLGFIPEWEGGSEEILRYVDEVVTPAYDKLGTDGTVSGYWHRVTDTGSGPQEYFQDGQFYRCPTCNRYWFVVLNESNVSYLFKRIAADQVNKPWAGTKLMRYEKEGVNDGKGK